MKSPSATLLCNTAVEAAHIASRILLKHFRTRLKIKEKPGAGLVTNADFESERATLKALKKAFPDFGFLAEESGAEESSSPGRWILDPLDGTSNYAHGLPTFCVSIAAEWEGQIVAGVILQPTTGELYTAIQGKGAFLNRKRIHV